jgi:hypothetical protein
MTIEKEYQEDSLLIFKGVLTVNLISILGNHLRLLISYDSKIFQKIFKIFVEVTQNVYYYSTENHEISEGIRGGAGWVSVQEFETEYRVTTGNQIKAEHAPKLVQYCTEINSMNEEQLRILKRETRSQAMVRDTGAHIGLIQTSIVSGNKLTFKIVEKAGSELEFILTTTITKESL